MASTATNSPLDICARALVLIGAEPLTSFEDQTTEALVASNMYEDVARASLLNTRWRFATDQAVLNRLSAAPTGRYDAAYQLPSATLMVHAVTENDYPIEYQRYGDKIYCDVSEPSVLICDYTFRAVEVDWPAYFSLAVQFSMASVFATSIARDSSLANMFEERSRNQMTKARTLDSQQQTTRKLNTSRFIAERRSY
jgi:hypothetical protein